MSKIRFGGLVRPNQNCSFKANCNCRDEPESAVGKRVLVMVVNEASVVGVKVAGKTTNPNMPPGWPKFG